MIMSFGKVSLGALVDEVKCSPNRILGIFQVRWGELVDREDDVDE